MQSEIQQKIDEATQLDPTSLFQVHQQLLVDYIWPLRTAFGDASRALVRGLSRAMAQGLA